MNMKKLTKWQQGELKMVEWLKSNVNGLSDLTHLASTPMSRFDCSNDKYVVELKHRRDDKSYDSQLLERSKGKALLEAAYQSNRKALYICYSGGIYYIFDLTQLHKSKHDFNWQEQMHNKTSRFSQQQKIKKLVSMVPNSLATKAFYEDGTEVKLDLDEIYELMAVA